jgi:hypothetical protein
MDLAVGRLEEAGDQPQRRGLAATGGAEQADQLSIFRETLSTTASVPNRLVRPRKSTDANRLTPGFVLARISARLGMPVYGQKRVGKE